MSGFTCETASAWPSNDTSSISFGRAVAILDIEDEKYRINIFFCWFVSSGFLQRRACAVCTSIKPVPESLLWAVLRCSQEPACIFRSFLACKMRWQMSYSVFTTEPPSLHLNNVGLWDTVWDCQPLQSPAGLVQDHWWADALQPRGQLGPSWWDSGCSSFHQALLKWDRKETSPSTKPKANWMKSAEPSVEPKRSLAMCWRNIRTWVWR